MLSSSFAEADEFAAACDAVAYAVEFDAYPVCPVAEFGWKVFPGLYTFYRVN